MNFFLLCVPPEHDNEWRTQLVPSLVSGSRVALVDRLYEVAQEKGQIWMHPLKQNTPTIPIWWDGKSLVLQSINDIAALSGSDNHWLYLPGVSHDRLLLQSGGPHNIQSAFRRACRKSTPGLAAIFDARERGGLTVLDGLYTSCPVSTPGLMPISLKVDEHVGKVEPTGWLDPIVLRLSTDSDDLLPTTADRFEGLSYELRLSLVAEGSRVLDLEVPPESEGRVRFLRALEKARPGERNALEALVLGAQRTPDIDSILRHVTTAQAFAVLDEMGGRFELTGHGAGDKVRITWCAPTESALTTNARFLAEQCVRRWGGKADWAPHAPSPHRPSPRSVHAYHPGVLTPISGNFDPQSCSSILEASPLSDDRQLAFLRKNGVIRKDSPIDHVHWGALWSRKVDAEASVPTWHINLFKLREQLAKALVPRSPLRVQVPRPGEPTWVDLVGSRSESERGLFDLLLANEAPVRQVQGEGTEILQVQRVYGWHNDWFNLLIEYNWNVEFQLVSPDGGFVIGDSPLGENSRLGAGPAAIDDSGMMF